MTTEYPQMDGDIDFAVTLLWQAARQRWGETPGQEQTFISAANKSGSGSK